MNLDKVLHDKRLEHEMTRKWQERRFEGWEDRKRGGGGIQKKDTRRREGGDRGRARS